MKIRRIKGHLIALSLLTLPLIPASQAAPIATGHWITINSSSLPNGSGIWTLDLTLSQRCPPPPQGYCESRLLFNDPDGDVLGMDGRLVRLSILNDTGSDQEILQLDLIDHARIVSFSPLSAIGSNRFNWLAYSSTVNYTIYVTGALPQPRAVQPGETLIVEFALTGTSPVSSFRLGDYHNTHPLPEPSTAAFTLAAASLIGVSAALAAYGKRQLS